MHSISNESGPRAFWRARVARVEAAAEGLRAALPPAVVEPGGAVRRPLTPGRAERLAKVTGGDATLEWTVVAAALAVALRRLGAGGAAVVLSGNPLPAGLPVVAELAAGQTFRELLGALRTEVAGVAAHAPLPDPALLDACSGPSAVRLVRAAPGSAGPSGPPAEDGLTLTLGDGWIEASSPSLAATLLEAVATGVVEVLGQGLDDPARTVAELGVLDEQTRHTVLTGFNETRRISGGTPLRELLLRQAARQPDAVAVHDADDAVTYAQLVRYATEIGTRLRAAGVGREDIVALAAPRGAWFVVAAVGILFSGAAYLPVDPTLPSGRREQLLDGVRAVLHTKAAGPTDDHGPRLWWDVDELCGLARDSVLHVDEENVTELLGPAPGPHDLAYVIYTSGSTGAPKGACLEHHSFLNFLAVRVVDCELRPGVEFPQTAPISFDISVWQMFAPLAGGATVCVVDDESAQDPAALSGLIARHGYAYIELVPTFIAVLLDQWAVEPGLRDAVGATLRGLVSTGEVLGLELARRWYAALPQVELSNAYGPAECTDDVVQGRVDVDDTSVFAAIGRPLPNTRVYVLDVDLQPVPPGVIGEIFVGGANVGRGYHRRPDLTERAFLTDPYAVDGWTRMYRTGDLGRWRADGVLECLGRADSQVKLRGRRIELGEISHVLETHPQVSLAAVVLVRTDGVERLVGFAAGVAGERPEAAALTEHLAERLPGFMVPHLVVVMDELPANRNGKVDHGALRELALRHGTRDVPYAAPRDELERELCAIWAALFGLDAEAVGVHDDFHALGGDSIVSIRVVQEAKRRGISLRPRLVLELRTVSALAEAVRAAGPQPTAATGSAPAADPAEDTPEEGGLRDLSPLTSAQADFLRLEMPEPDHWNSSLLFTLPAGVPTADVERAVGELARRHRALSGRFTRTDGGPGQGWVPQAPPVTVFELTATAAPEQEGEIHRLATTLHTALSLTDGPVCRVGVFRLGTDADRLVLIVHHALLDQYSWDILAEELSVLLRDGGPAGLPEVGTSCYTWARRLADDVRRDPARWDEAYWTRAVPHPGVTLGPAERGLQRDEQQLVTTLDRAATARFLDARGRTESVTERLAAALTLAVARWLGTEGGELLVQLGGHGREDLYSDLDVTGTVGYFSTAYPVLLPLPDGPDGRRHAADVARRLREVPGKGMGFGLLRSLHPDPAVRTRLDQVPTPPVVFDFLGETRLVDVEDTQGRLDFLSRPTYRHSGEARALSMPRAALLDVRVSIDDGRLQVAWLFSHEALPAARVQELAHRYEAALRLGDDEKEDPR